MSATSYKLSLEAKIVTRIADQVKKEAAPTQPAQPTWGTRNLWNDRPAPTQPLSSTFHWATRSGAPALNFGQPEGPCRASSNQTSPAPQGAANVTGEPPLSQESATSQTSERKASSEKKKERSHTVDTASVPDFIREALRDRPAYLAGYGQIIGPPLKLFDFTESNFEISAQGTMEKSYTQAFKDGHCISVSNLNFSCQVKEIEKIIKEKAKDDCVCWWTPVKEGHRSEHLGWCHVQFASAASAEKAMGTLDGLKAMGRQAKIKGTIHSIRHCLRRRKLRPRPSLWKLDIFFDQRGLVAQWGLIVVFVISLVFQLHSAFVVSLTKQLAIPGFTEKDVECWMNFIEQFFACAFQTLPTLFLSSKRGAQPTVATSWTPEWLVAEEEVGLNQKLPICQNTDFGNRFGGLANSADPEVRAAFQEWQSNHLDAARELSYAAHKANNFENVAKVTKKNANGNGQWWRAADPAKGEPASARCRSIQQQRRFYDSNQSADRQYARLGYAMGSSVYRIIDVSAQFQGREEDGSLKPDIEYAIADAEDDLDHVHLEMAKPGHLTSSRWTPRASKPLVGDDIGAYIYAAGLDFRATSIGYGHMEKIVISMRGADGSVKVDTPALIKPLKKLELDNSASCLLVGGFGGLGHSVARYPVEHNSRRLVFPSRSGGAGPKDVDSVRELESMGCDVRVVKGSVASADDVARVLQQAGPALKGIMQLSMVLRDEAFPRMRLDDWDAVVAPKLCGTWFLHEGALAAGIDIDFFVLFSSLSGVLANPVRVGLGLPAASVDIGIAQDIDAASLDKGVMRMMKQAKLHMVTEPELLETISAPITINWPHSAGLTIQDGSAASGTTGFVEKHTLMIGDQGSSNADGLQALITRVRSAAAAAEEGGASAMLRVGETAAFLAREIGRKLFTFLLQNNGDLAVCMSVPLPQLEMDSLEGLEMRNWWCQAFGFDITVLEQLGIGNLDLLGKHAAEGLERVLG
ncbi:hypothetical protein DL765_004453 [Monosporascus sp. GIB2]|nr:hypothetical protein DL765_004453 [Monosporascus sp. GIB2]